ncbi:putative s-adenosylmethionine-dependent methyltransferase superfamily domain-containing protein [Diaporthe ampelina]|uniref:Nucleolar protein 2 n=1 Tax=Diaporthe ampelina TaxID=1214573 RepID=A0A0G2FT66_9PEZI|nr:putative s-adenosylmethionine-dependent methyltransferase superfamily domain-containing protein [Diaporthe ampelina]
MGVGRRMKKQGPPERLSEEHFAKLKRKKGLPADIPEEAPAKKRRTNKADSVPKSNGAKKSIPAAKVSSRQQDGSKPKGKESKKQSSRSKKAAVPEPEGYSDIEIDDKFGDSDLEGKDLSDSDDDEPAKLGDDFLGSDSGDSVYDSDDDRKKEFVFSEDEDDSDAEQQLTAANIEGLSRKLDKQMEEEAADAQAELEEAALQTNISGDPLKVLDEEEEGEESDAKKAILAPDLQLLRNRITDNIRILEDFSKLAEEGRSRAEYTAQLIKDICAYYGYSEYMAEKLYHLFSPSEAFDFFEANESARPMVIRTNTLRTNRRDLASALINRGVTLEPVGKWSKVGLQIFESNVPLGATPEYLAGHYIIQAASSFLPVMALAPQENERVLDMSAAPGGKTTHMAALMRNTGCIFANDMSKSRAKGLIGNIHRLGCRNVVVCNYDAREFPKPIGGFDRVLLDAPCTGTGVIAKDASVKTNKTEKDFMAIPHTQKQLLLAAIDSVNHHSKTGGYIVYSTCSVSVEENEQVVAYALAKRPNVKLVDTNLPFGNEGFVSYRGKTFHPSLKLSRRYYPHTYNVDGFFVAKFKKTGPTPANAVLADRTGTAKERANGGKQQQQQQQDEEDEEIVDKTPIGHDEGTADDDFGGFDEDEDEKIMERGKRNAMRRRGLDPKALNKNKNKNKEKKETEADTVDTAAAAPASAKSKSKSKPKKTSK